MSELSYTILAFDGPEGPPNNGADDDSGDYHFTMDSGLWDTDSIYDIVK